MGMPESLGSDNIRQQIHERAHSFLGPNSSAFYRSLVGFIDEQFLPKLPAGFSLNSGAFNAYPGTLAATLNYMADIYGHKTFLADHLDTETDYRVWEPLMQEVYNFDPEQFYRTAQERVHLVSHPYRVSPLQYLLPPMGSEGLNILDVGAATHIALPLLNHPSLLDQNFHGKDDVLDSLGHQTDVQINRGYGVELVPMDETTERWLRAGFWRNPNRKYRIRDFGQATEIANNSRNKFPQIQADALTQHLRPDSLDAISAIFSQHQLPDPKQFREICQQILKPGGILVVIGAELMESGPRQHKGWRVDVHYNGPEGLLYHSTPFYLTEDQVTLDRVDVAGWKRYLELWRKP